MACNKIKEMMSYIIRDDMMRELRMRNKFLYAGFVYVHTWHKFYARSISYLILCKKVCRNGGSV